MVVLKKLYPLHRRMFTCIVVATQFRQRHDSIGNYNYAICHTQLIAWKYGTVRTIVSSQMNHHMF